MSNAEDMRKLMAELISSCESRVSAACAMVDNTRQILDGFSEKRSVMGMQLKKTFAREKSFCEKEFDRMMTEILGPQEAIENETRILLNIYLDEQKEAAKTIRKNIGRHKIDHVEVDAARINEFRSWIADVHASQRVSEKQHDIELRDMLKTIYNKHKMTIEFLQIFMVKETDDKTQCPTIMVRHKSHHSEGWWEVFKHTISQWRGLIATDRQNMYMAQRRILTVSPIIMLDYFKQIEKTGS